MKLTSDNPIDGPDGDQLGRVAGAERFAQHVLALDASQGLVVGVLGPWGSGKTSFINLARQPLLDAGATIVDFNPWMFSGAEQLVDWFFNELAAQLRMKPHLAEVGKDFEEYGELFAGMGWVPLVGPWIERGRAVNKIITKLMQRRKEGITDRRSHLQAKLASLPNPIVVIVDDIDRLSTDEIRELFKLVRLTANFPNVIYIVAFDRLRVEQALDDATANGRAYLEKILQLAVDLPAVPESVLLRLLQKELQIVAEKVDVDGPLDADRWQYTLMEVIWPLIHTMRDVRRYSLAVYGTLRDINGQIDLGDILGLEAIRVFLPDVFARLDVTADALTGIFEPSSSGPTNKDVRSAAVKDLVASAGAEAEAARNMVTRLFPAGAQYLGGNQLGPGWESTWLVTRRVAHHDLLMLFLERVAGANLSSFFAAEHAWSRMNDAEALDAYLRTLDPDALQDVVSALGHFSGEFEGQHVVPTLTVLLNLAPEMTARDYGFATLRPLHVVGQIGYQLLSRLSTDQVQRYVDEILPAVNTLGSKLALIDWVGHRANAGDGFVSQPVATAYERAWRDQVRSAPPSRISGDPECLDVVRRVQQDAGDGEDELIVDGSPKTTLAFLRAARTNRRGQVEGNRAVRKDSRLRWDTLAAAYGSQEILIGRINAAEAEDESDAELLALAKRYAGGWRPDH